MSRIVDALIQLITTTPEFEGRLIVNRVLGFDNICTLFDPDNGDPKVN